MLYREAVDMLYKDHAEVVNKTNIKAHSCKNFRSGKTISITFSECVFVALGTHQGMSMRHIVICGLSSSTLFSTLSNKRQDFRKKKNITEHKLCVLIFSIISIGNISHSKKN